MARAAGAWALRSSAAAAACEANPVRTCIGENMYWSSAYRWKDDGHTAQPLDPAYVVDQWAQRAPIWIPETRQCRPGRSAPLPAAGRAVGAQGRLVCPALDQVWICQYRLG